MSWTILDKPNQGVGFADCIQQRLDNFEVASFVAGADVVYRSRPAFLQSQEYGATMVFNIDPVSDILTITIDRDWLIVERIREHQRQKFLGKLSWSIVIAASSHHRVEAKRVMGGPNQMFRCRFRSGVRTVWSERRFLREESVLSSQASSPSPHL